jgi:translation initiation factor 2 gamma subunit (eIF-2gamma)
MTKETAKKHARTTGKFLGGAALFTLAAFAAAGEEQERQRRIQEHVDALAVLEPNAQVIIARKY